MAKALYLEDSYQKEFTAKVISIKDGKFVVLDQTVFYPNSGGQLHDTGKIIKDNKEYEVVFVGKFNGEISHEIKVKDDQGDDISIELKEGDEIKGIINWERRYQLMKMHTTAHLVSSKIFKETGAKITGNQLNINKSRVDFELENFDKELLKSFINDANEIISKNIEVTHFTISREDAEQREDLSRLAKGLPNGIKNIRIVKIGNYDEQADGGTHVKNTSEIGKVVYLNAKNKGSKRRRVYFGLEK